MSGSPPLLAGSERRVTSFGPGRGLSLGNRFVGEAGTGARVLSSRSPKGGRGSDWAPTPGEPKVAENGAEDSAGGGQVRSNGRGGECELPERGRGPRAHHAPVCLRLPASPSGGAPARAYAEGPWVPSALRVAGRPPPHSRTLGPPRPGVRSHPSTAPEPARCSAASRPLGRGSRRGEGPCAALRRGREGRPSEHPAHSPAPLSPP